MAKKKVRADELLGRAERDPDDAALREVLADALTEAGDPRGELAAVQTARANLEALVHELAKVHGAAVYGEKVDGLTLGTDSGFIDAIDLRLGAEQYKAKLTARRVLERVLALRAGRLVRTIDLELSHAKAAHVVKDATAALALLREHAALRELSVRFTADDGPVDVDLAPVLAKHPITKLSVYGSPATFKSVLAKSWPTVTTFAFRVYSDKPLTAAALKRLFEGTTFPKLTTLVPDLAPTTLGKLFASPLAKQLKTIDLSWTSFDDDVAKVVLSSKKRLAKLERFVVDDCDHVTVARVRQLQGLCQRVVGVPTAAELAWVEAQHAAHEHDHYEEIEE
jgi:hypothetical protein